jgi:hypothetical protein
MHEDNFFKRCVIPWDLNPHKNFSGHVSWESQTCPADLVSSNRMGKTCQFFKKAISFAKPAPVCHKQGNVRRAIKLANEALSLAQSQEYLVLEKKFQAIVEEISGTTQEGT